MSFSAVISELLVSRTTILANSLPMMAQPSKCKLFCFMGKAKVLNA